MFDPEQVSYRQLLEFFYKMHDPTTSDRQGPDWGSQYRSAIFFHDEEQEKVAKDVTEKANKQWYKGKIASEVVPAGEWYDAETYHQLVSNTTTRNNHVYREVNQTFSISIRTRQAMNAQAIS